MTMPRKIHIELDLDPQMDVKAKTQEVRSALMPVLTPLGFQADNVRVCFPDSKIGLWLDVAEPYTCVLDNDEVDHTIEFPDGLGREL